MWNVIVRKKIRKNADKLPQNIGEKFAALLNDLKFDGPVQSSWSNYSKLSGGEYHCHLNYHYVACWTAEERTITIEVYYVGSREKAPY